MCRATNMLQLVDTQTLEHVEEFWSKFWFRFEVMWGDVEPQTCFKSWILKHIVECWSKVSMVLELLICFWNFYQSIGGICHWQINWWVFREWPCQTNQTRIFSWILTSGASCEIHISFKRSRQCYLWSKKESLKVTFLEKSLISDFEQLFRFKIVWESFSNLILPFDISEWNAKFALISFPHFKFSFPSSNLACTTSMKLQTQSPKS